MGDGLRYQVYRSLARKRVEEVLLDQPALLKDGVQADQVRMEPITPACVEASLQWGDSATLFPWECVQRWKGKDRRGFDLAIWHASELCGLCYATPRKSRLCIKIILLESQPGRSHPLAGSVAALAIMSTEFYGRMLGCREIEIENPVFAIRPLYEALGFKCMLGSRLVMKIDP
ncbi:N-acetyltransferase [Pseudomonas sp. NPDC089406]|uniref:N-acetyltransferase n=1 Tax=Pseudomonas sp. NPDC089406 TaxID=3364463 RepID=UPI00384DF29C